MCRLNKANIMSNPKLPEYSPYDHKCRKGPVILALMVFYLAALLLNAEGIRKDIELMDYGPTRSFCLKVFEPALVFSRALQLTKPKAWIEQTAGAWIKNKGITP